MSNIHNRARFRRKESAAYGGKSESRLGPCDLQRAGALVPKAAFPILPRQRRSRMAAAARRERLTVEVDTDLRKSIAHWAREEGRPVANLLRRIVATATAEHDKRLPDN